MPLKHCVMCGNEFEAKTAWKRYCSRACEAKKWRITKGLNKLKDGRFCRQCGEKFFPSGRGGNNKQHCSPECSKKSARESRSKFWNKFGDKKKQKMSEYHLKSREKVGPDGNLKRFYKRYPDAPRECQSCGEKRVLDIAHKPEHRRNGSWRSVGNTTTDKVWILCPTCHALLDRMRYLPSELGLL
jgi:hypothetical protein